MNLTIGGQAVVVHVEDRATFVSRHTGRELLRLRVSLVALGRDEHDQLRAIVKEGLTERVIGDESGEHTWRLVNHSFSYREGGPVAYHHSFQLEEDEELMPSALRLANLVLHPHKYEEEFDRDALVITAWTVLSEEDTKELVELRSAGGYFSVVREGIDDASREMRFGQVLWSESEGRKKIRVTLVERSYDEQGDGGPGFLEPHASNVQRQLAVALGTLDGILQHLEEKGLMNAEERGRVLSEAEDQTHIRVKEWVLNKVEDVDEW